MRAWPLTLPRYFNTAGFTYTDEGGVIRTDIQVGFAEARSVISDSVWRVRGNMTIRTELFPVLVTFYELVLADGTLRFVMGDPLEEFETWHWRFTTPFVVTAFGGEHLTIHLDLERIPGTRGELIPGTPPPLTGCTGLMDGAGIHLVDAAGACLTS